MHTTTKDNTKGRVVMLVVAAYSSQSLDNFAGSAKKRSPPSSVCEFWLTQMAGPLHRVDSPSNTPGRERLQLSSKLFVPSGTRTRFDGNARHQAPFQHYIPQIRLLFMRWINSAQGHKCCSETISLSAISHENEIDQSSREEWCSQNGGCDETFRAGVFQHTPTWLSWMHCM